MAVTIIVPVLGRPQNAAPFMASLRASGFIGPPLVMAQAFDTETIAAWENAGAIVGLSEHRSFASKVNLGTRKSASTWILPVGDDVVFWPGWLPAARTAAGDRYHLVATNDLGNPQVLAGEHATHPLIRRSWIETSGASWDGPGTVAHEGYGHGWVDAEWTAKARAEDVFVYAPDAVIEHCHPTWGRGARDHVYELGMSTYDDDRRLFEARLAAAS